MKRRITSIYLSDNIRAIIRPDEETFSGRLADVSDRYLSIIKGESIGKSFNDIEKAFLAKALSHIPLDSSTIRAIPFFVVDYLSRNKGFDGDDNLNEKLEKLTFVQLIALAEEIELLILKEKS
jgi:hypothetical protein